MEKSTYHMRGVEATVASIADNVNSKAEKELVESTTINAIAQAPCAVIKDGKGGNKEITKDEFVSTSWDLSDSISYRQAIGTNSEIFNALNKNYREHGESKFLDGLRSYSNGVSNVISCALQVIFTNNPKFAELSYNDFLNRTGLKDGCFSDQTFLNNKNAFKIISKIKDHDTREKLRNCGVSVVVKFLRISERKDFEALIKKFLSGPSVSRSNAEEYVNSLFSTKKLSVRLEDAKNGSITLQAKSAVEKVGSPNRFGYEDKPVDASVLAPEEARQEKDSEELPNNEDNPDIGLEEVNGYSRESLGVRIDIVGHGQIDVEKIEASFESMREYLSLFVERYAEGEPEWNNIEKLMNYLKSHLDNKSQTSEKDALEFAGADASDVPTENKNSPASGGSLAITESKLQGLPTDSPKQLSLGILDRGSKSSTESHSGASENADEKAKVYNTTASQEVSGSPINESNIVLKDALELADTGLGKLPEKHEDSPKREDTGLSANSELTESPKNASKVPILEKVSVLMSGFTGNEVLALKQKLVSNITKVIRESGIGYVSKDHPRAMQIAWEIVKNGLDAEKLRGVDSVAGLYSKFFPNGNSKEGGL